ncbi:MAG: helix-turn-helix domain-containing protein, partial [Bacteroidota bacterium]
ALSIISFCLLSSKTLLHTLGLWDTHVFRYFPLGIDLAIQPCIYFYIIHLIAPKKIPKIWYFLHFAPFITSELYSLFVYVDVLQTTNLEVKDVIAESFYFNRVKHIEDYLTLISTFTYISIGLFKLKIYRRWLDMNISDSAYPTFNWLRLILIQLIIIGCLLLVNLLLDRFIFPGTSNFLRWQVFYIVVAGHIYYLGFRGINLTSGSHHQSIPTQPKIQKLTQAQVDEIISKIEIALKENKVHLNPKLSGAELASKIETSQSSLSYALNLHYKKNFRELVNQYRVEEAKSKLVDPSLSHLSILGIAFESGFSSEASFYRIFKKTTGKSPAEYQKAF